MSLWSKVKNGLDMAQVCTMAIELIGDLVKKKPSLETLDVVGKIVDQVKDVISGKSDAAATKARFEGMRDDLASNNKDIDEDIDAKFK